jgi:EAL domain-containing protein (putative c-di-GMP-specific phosphodiesterase class I)
MRTQVVRDSTPGLPRLEREAAAGQPPECVLLEAFPFTIGRSEEASLRVESTRVSREHAVIERVGLEYRVRDNGSTNGTFVNGRRVQEAPLTDGDMLKIADTEFCFFSGRQDPPRELATQLMTQAGWPLPGDGGQNDQVHGLRRLHEALMLASAVPQFQPVVHLSDGSVHGYEAVPLWVHDPSSGGEIPRLLASCECRLTARWHQIERLAAAEQAAHFQRAQCVFLNVAPSEIGNTAALAALEHLAAILGGGGRLVCAVPDNVVSDGAYFRAFRGRLRDWGARLACDGVTAGPAQLREHRAAAPDYLRLAPALARDVHRNADRRRHLQAVVRAAQDLAAQVIAAGIAHARDADVCRDLGCPLAQGEPFGPPRPAAVWMADLRQTAQHAASRSTSARRLALSNVQPRS